MKASTAYLLTALLGATQVHAQCVEGTVEEISPGYTVNYKCDMLRTGTTHRGIKSATECAQLASDSGATASTYHAGLKRCVIASEDGVDQPYPGATCMVKVVEDTFIGGEHDPFLPDPEEEIAACLEREEALKEQLAASQAESSTGKGDSARLKDILASNCPAQHNKYGTVDGTEYKFWCTRYPDPASPKETHKDIDTMEACVKLCNTRSWCTYVLHGAYLPTCQLYTRAFAHGTSPPNADSQWNSAVKKR
ncbi:hypothetical protein ACHAQD_009097 [Fusarium lateritium]